MPLLITAAAVAPPGNGDVTDSVSNGLLELDLDDGGTAELLVLIDKGVYPKSWENADASRLLNFKCHKLYVGTATGVYDWELDLSAYAQPGARWIKLTGLREVIYYIEAATLNSADVESAASTEQSRTAATAAALPSYTQVDIGQADFPYTASTASREYRLTENVTVNSGVALTANADDIIVNLNGFTLTVAQTGTGSGVRLNPGADRVRVRNGTITGDTGGTGPSSTRGLIEFDILGMGSDCIVEDCTLNMNDDWMAIVGSDNGDNIHADGRGFIFRRNTINMFPGTTSGNFTARGISQLFDVIGYGNTWNVSGTKRDPAYFNWEGEVFGETWTANEDVSGSNLETTYITNDGDRSINSGRSQEGTYIHDNTLNNYIGKARTIHSDGTPYMQIHYNTVNMLNTDDAEDSRGIGFRGVGAEQCSVGYNTVNVSNYGGNRAFRFGGEEPAASLPPTDIYCYGNTVTGDTSGGFGFELYRPMDDLQSWDNDYGERGTNTDTDTSGVIYSRNDTMTSDFSIGTDTWRMRNGFSTQGTTYGTDAAFYSAGGFDPSSKTPAAPTVSLQAASVSD